MLGMGGRGGGYWGKGRGDPGQEVDYNGGKAVGDGHCQIVVNQ